MCVRCVVLFLCVCGVCILLCVVCQLPLYRCHWSLVAYEDMVFDISSGEQCSVASFDHVKSGFCSIRMASRFPTSFHLPRTVGILAEQGYSLYAVGWAWENQHGGMESGGGGGGGKWSNKCS